MGRDPITKAATDFLINPLLGSASMVQGLMGAGSGSINVPPVTPITPAPTEDDAAIKEAAAKERELEKKRKGRAATILTGGLGDTSTAPTTRKILLGE